MNTLLQSHREADATIGALGDFVAFIKNAIYRFHSFNLHFVFKFFTGYIKVEL